MSLSVGCNKPYVESCTSADTFEYTQKFARSKRGFCRLGVGIFLVQAKGHNFSPLKSMSYVRNAVKAVTEPGSDLGRLAPNEGVAFQVENVRFAGQKNGK